MHTLKQVFIALLVVTAGTLAAIAPASADKTETTSIWSFTWSSEGSYRDIGDSGTYQTQHNRYRHTIRGESAFHWRAAPAIRVHSKFKDTDGIDRETSWHNKGRCVPRKRSWADDRGTYHCTIYGTMGDRWEEQKLKYRAEGGTTYQGRVEFTGRMTFRWLD